MPAGLEISRPRGLPSTAPRDGSFRPGGGPFPHVASETGAPCSLHWKDKAFMVKRVAVVGLAFRFPGTNARDYWPDLLDGKDLVTQVDPARWATDTFLHPGKSHPGTSYTFAAGSIGDVAGFDAGFFGISPREAALMDPQQRLLLELGWEAMENAGIPASSLRGSDCGVYIGIASADYSYRMSDDLDAIDASMATGNTASIAANRLSYAFDLHGPSMAVDTACSSSLVAVHQACQAIRAGEIEQALAGGVSLHLHPYGFISFSKASMLSRAGRCQVFDADGDGYVRSEGGGLFLLKSYERAVADGDRILAVVANTVVNTDGRKSGLTVPNADAQIALLRQAYAQAGIGAGEIDYLEAHGTGTAVGDPIETHAIGQALGQVRERQRPLPIGSVKSNMGHLEAASGVAGLVKALYCLRHREIPATIGIKTLNPRIDFDGLNLEVVQERRPLRAAGRLVAGVNSFGFGGANAHVILHSHDAPAREHPRKLAQTAPIPMVVSGKTPEALKAAAGDMADALSRLTGAEFYDAAYHAAFRRDWHEHRALAFGTSAAAVAEALRGFALGHVDAGSVQSGTEIPRPQGPVFVYSGNGSQWAGMGRRLLDDPLFAETLHEIDALFRPRAGYSLADELAGRNGDGRYAYTEIAQPALFALQVGMTRMLRQRGVEPVAVVGHSVGEIAAAWACGAVTLEQAVRVIHHRSRLQGTTKGQGQMTALGLGQGELAALLQEHRLSSLCVAGANSSAGSTVAGHPDQLDLLEAELAQRRVPYKRLDLDYAFHSPAMDTLRPRLLEALGDLAPAASAIPYYSTVTGGRLDGGALDAAYWWRNIREPVLFQQAIDALTTQGANLFVEVGPHPVLRSYLNHALKDAGLRGLVIATAARGDDDPAKVRAAAGQAIVAGATPDWTILFPWSGRHIDLPGYPWQRERHWHPTTAQSFGLLERRDAHPLLGHALAQQPHTWEGSLDTLRHPWLADHVVDGATVFPGTGYAEIALAAARQAYPGDHLQVEELEIHAPLLLAQEPSKLLRMRVDPADGRFALSAREQNGGAWSAHASGRLLQQASGLALRAAAPVRPQQAETFSGAEHAALTRMAGLDYGPAFRLIDHGWHEAPGVVAAALLPAADPLAGAMLLHPAVLDCTFQLIIQLLKDDPALGHGVAFVPARIGRLTLRAGGVPAVVRARLLRRAPHSLLAEFALFDAQGAQVAAVQEARFRSVRLRAAAAMTPDYLDYVGSPRPLPGPVRAPLLAASGLRKALAACVVRDGGWSRSERYAAEVDPLLDSLCDQFAVEALRALSEDGTHLSSETAVRCRQQATGAGALLNVLLDRAVQEQLATTTPSGWTLAAPDPEMPAAVDIWNSLVREYPDDFPAIQAVGRVGLHLAGLLRGELAHDSVRPSWATHAAAAALLRGPDESHAVGRCLANVLGRAARRATHARLSVLELGAEGPVFGPACCAALDFARADYCYASLDDTLPEAAQRLQEQFPDAELRVAVHGTTGAGDRFDLAIVHVDFDTLAQACDALEYAQAGLAPGGTLLLCGQHPARWIDFVLGARRDWWVDGPAGARLSSQQPAAFWAQRLEQLLGEPCDAPLEFAPDRLAGGYLLTARKPRQPAARPRASTDPDAAAKSWLVLADESGPSAALAASVARGLETAGNRVQLAAPGDESQMAACIAQAKAQSGAIDHMLLLAGFGTSRPQDDATALLERQADRCALAATVVRACEREQAAPTLWLVTCAAMQGLAGAAPRGAPLELHELNDAATWAYGRTLMNEANPGQVRLVDLPDGAAGHAAALLQELLHPGAEQEVILAADGARIAPRLARLPAAAPDPADAPHVRLGFEFPGQLRNLRWESHAVPAPADDELEVEVRATGLNFRDVMYALGLLSDEAVENGFAGPTLGLEFAGVVLRAGSRVRGYRPGDAVVGFGPASFGTRTLARTDAIAPIPAGFSFESAATIPSTFFTVYYALEHLARLEEGESILIHGAAGGVGIAAVQFAQWRGAEIHATAGSPEKRDFLRLMGVEHIYDSRSLEYAEEILERTGGRGVDVVLNSLAGEAINRNLGVLKPFGRFLELGKRDFYENTRIGLRPFRNNISYFGIDADQLMRERPGLTRRLFGDMMALFEQGVLHPLPYRAFDANEIVDAFRYMQQARQIGKVVVTYRNALRAVHAPRPQARPALALRADASYLVTGGLGGFGLRTAQWLAEKGARHLVLLGRSGIATDEARDGVAGLESRGVTVHAAACDVTDRTALAALFERIATTLPPLAGIVHAATVIDDGLVRNADRDQIRRVLAPKVLGAAHLHELTLDTPLDFFVLFSSATTLFGNPGQSNYVAANGWLETLAERRRAAGLPATCVRWGAIDDVGFLARNEKIKNALQGRMGGSALPSAAALAALEDVLLTGRSGMGVLDLDWRSLARFLPTAGTPKFEFLARRSTGGDGDDGQADDIAAMLETLEPPALHARIVEILKAEVGEILRLPADKIDASGSVYDLGLDSLMGVELAVALEARFGIRLPVMALSESPTIDRLAERLIRMLKGEADGERDELEAQVARVAAQHAAEADARAIEQLAADLKSGTHASSRMIH